MKDVNKTDADRIKASGENGFKYDPERTHSYTVHNIKTNQKLHTGLYMSCILD